MKILDGATIRLTKQVKRSIGNVVMRTHNDGKMTDYRMFATHRVKYNGMAQPEVIKDENNSLGKIRVYNPKKYINQDMEKAISRVPKEAFRTVSDVLTYTDTKDLLIAILNFNGYHANEVLYGKKQDVGNEKLRLAVNTMVHITLADGTKISPFNVHEVVLKEVFWFVRVADAEPVLEVVAKTKTEIIREARTVSLTDDLTVEDKTYESIVTKRTNYQTKQTRNYHDLYEIFICGNNIRNINKKMSELIAIYNIH